MYRQTVGGFLNQDTYTGGEGGPAVTDDPHAHAGDGGWNYYKDWRNLQLKIIYTL
jgi:hypothetical protein